MSNTVIQVSDHEMKEIQAFYKQYQIDKAPPGSVFVAKYKGCTITAYRSGKVMFQGVGNENEAKKWGKPTSKKTSTRKTSGAPLPDNISSLSVIGSDEVGKGDYFGPMTVVATYVNKEQIPLLQELGVKDSKNLSDKEIIEIAKQLLTFLPYSLLKLNNEKYNQLQASGYTQGKMTAILHNRALNNVLKKIAPDTPDAILVDQFAEAGVYFNHLKGQRAIIREKVYFSTQAESIHLAVAAASILARYAFLNAMEQLSEQAGFPLPKGAGPKVDQAAAKLIQQQGMDALRKFTKFHFANTAKAKRLANR